MKKFFHDVVDINRIVKTEGKEAIYYAFGFLQAVLLMLKGCRYIYEISDILYGYPKYSFLQFLFKKIDAIVVRHSVVTVMTSEGFREYLFGKENPSNIVILPNKLNNYFVNFKRESSRKIDPNHIVFSFVGAVRYRETVLRFAKIVGKYFKCHEFHFYGDSSFVNSFKQETSEYDNVKFFGAYKNPEDLEAIYSNIDIVVACYESISLNERIAEPNKLYESLFFEKPIVVSKDTYLARQVKKYKCGWSINAYSDDEIKDFIKSLSENILNEIILNEHIIPSSQLLDNEDDLLKLINEKCLIN